MSMIPQLFDSKFRLTSITALLLPGFLLCFFSSAYALDQRDQCVKKYDPEKDYFPDKVWPTHAKGFEVRYYNNYKLLRINDFTKALAKNFTYMLVQCGTPVPKGVERDMVITVPVKRTVLLSTTQIPSMVRLKLADRIVALGSSKYVNTPEIRRMIRQGIVKDVGRGGRISVENTLSMNPDLVFYGVGMVQDTMYQRLMELGINVGIFMSHMEASPLGRSEWMKMVSLFFNREKEANREFDTIVREYQKVADLAKKARNRPTVFSGVDYSGTWFMPARNSYVAALFRDAGADYLWKNKGGTVSLHLDFEAVLDRAIDADYWLNVGHLWRSREDAIAADERYAHFKALRIGQVYNNNAILNPDGGNDYWENGLDNPHLLLADLVRIFHPELLPTHALRWYRPLVDKKKER